MAAEKDFEHKIEKWLHSIGVYSAGTPENLMTVAPNGWYFKVWGGGYQRAGIPDLICNLNGYFLAIEIKAQTGRPSALQSLNIDRIRKTYGEAVVLYPSGFEDFKKVITYFINHHNAMLYKLRKEYK